MGSTYEFFRAGLGKPDCQRNGVVSDFTCTRRQLSPSDFQCRYTIDKFDFVLCI